MTCHLSQQIDWLQASKYRYGDSNPGFRTENCLCEAVWGRFVPVASKEINPVPLSSVESGTYLGTPIRVPRYLLG